jgi:CHAD domain-containing protein
MGHREILNRGQDAGLDHLETLGPPLDNEGQVGGCPKAARGPPLSPARASDERRGSMEDRSLAFQLKAGESASKGIKRIARDQIDKALEGLTGKTGAEPEEVVHDARKRFKKVRALLRLARRGIGRRVYDRENARLRDAGRPLSQVRDGGVLVGALDRLAERLGDPDSRRAMAGVREALLEHKRALLSRVLDEEDAPANVVATVQEARKRLKDWDLDEDGWSALKDGLRWIYTRGHRAFRQASDRPSVEALHQWRKRVKDLRYAVEILRPVRPGFLVDLGEQAHRLADALGDDHDLAVLREVLTDPARGIGADASAGPILTLIDDRRAELRQDAIRLGRLVYRDRPKVFVKRIGAYWRAWRAELAAAEFEVDRDGGRSDGLA